MALLQPQQPPVDAGMPAEAGQMPPEQTEDQMPDEQGEGEDAPDPAYDAAYEWMLQKLYDKKLADKIVSVAKGEGDSIPMLTDMAYQLTAKADEATGGEVMEENLVSLGALALAEVFEVAVAAGAKFESADMASGLKQMVMRYLQESGIESGQLQQLQQAMNQVSPKQFNELAKTAEGQEPAEMEAQ